jgi:hypothetical protein
MGIFLTSGGVHSVSEAFDGSRKWSRLEVIMRHVGKLLAGRDFSKVAAWNDGREDRSVKKMSSTKSNEKQRKEERREKNGAGTLCSTVDATACKMG